MKQKIQLVLVFVITVAAFRTAFILYERYADNAAPSQKQAPPLQADYYVIPKKLYPYDLKSAQQLTQQPVCRSKMWSLMLHRMQAIIK
jgi:hypothetical protein